MARRGGREAWFQDWPRQAGVVGWGWGGVGSRKGLGKRGPKGGVRREFLLLGPVARTKPAGMGLGPAAPGRGAKATVSASPGPPDGVMSGERPGTELWPGERYSPSGSLRERGWAGAEGRAVRHAEPKMLK